MSCIRIGRKHRQQGEFRIRPVLSCFIRCDVAIDDRALRVGNKTESERIMKTAPIALQLYTVRDVLADDFAGTLKKIADIGYAGVELAGSAGYSAQELRTMIGDLGLGIAGNHVGIEGLETDLEAALDYNEALGNRVIVCPYMPEDRRRTGDDWRKAADLFTEVGARCRDRGMSFAYHNHSFEFARFEGKTGLDILFDTADPELVGSELDLYWVLHGGEDPASYLRKLGSRVVLVHLKDMAAGEERAFAEVGEGIIDWPAVFEACEATSAGWYIVEQDICARPSLDSAAISLRNLLAMGLS